MTVRLRGHHLLCLLTYKGEGYGPAFVANLDRIAARLAADEDVLLVDGPDDVCAPRLAPDTADEDAPHCRLDRIRDRDRRALEAVTALLNRALGPGARLRLDPANADRMRAAFATGEIRSACSGCQWSAFCTAAADARFADTLLLGATRPRRAGYPAAPAADSRPASRSSQSRKAAIRGSSAASSKQTT